MTKKHPVSPKIEAICQEWAGRAAFHIPAQEKQNPEVQIHFAVAAKKSGMPSRFISTPVTVTWTPVPRNLLIVPTVREHRNAQQFRSKTGVVVRPLECPPKHVHSRHCIHVEVRVRHSLVLLMGLVPRMHGA